MTKIYRATIWASPEFEATYVEWERFGADKKALKAMQMAHALTIAPEEAWTFDEVSGEASVEVSGEHMPDTSYTAECVRLELVC